MQRRRLSKRDPLTGSRPFGSKKELRSRTPSKRIQQLLLQQASVLPPSQDQHRNTIPPPPGCCTALASASGWVACLLPECGCCSPGHDHSRAQCLLVLMTRRSPSVGNGAGALSIPPTVPMLPSFERRRVGTSKKGRCFQWCLLRLVQEALSLQENSREAVREGTAAPCSRGWGFPFGGPPYERGYLAFWLLLVLYLWAALRMVRCVPILLPIIY